jgi:hypothetical protein
MKKKIIVLSITTILILLLTSLTPAFASNRVDSQTAEKTVTIEVNKYVGKKTETILTEVSAIEAEQIKHDLLELSSAQQQNNLRALSQYKSLLSRLGVSDTDYRQFVEQDKNIDLWNSPKYIRMLNGTNISNSLCFFNAIGEGLMLFILGVALIQSMKNALSNVTSVLAGLILLLIFLPLLVLVLLLTDLVPFRILAPNGSIALQNGTISTLGLQGRKKITVGADLVEVNLSWFTGITINIPPINGKKSFLFMSGFAFSVNEISP